MSKGLRNILTMAVVLHLCGCVSYNPNGYTNYQSYVYGDRPLYPERYHYVDQINYTTPPPPAVREVVVPETYHVGAYHSPASHEDRDRSWVETQSPQSYTIEVAEGNKPAEVARQLYKAPKNDRTAQLKYDQNGQTYYKGLYGSYNSYEAAQQAYNALPEDVKAGAKITTFSSVQSNR